MLGAVLLLIAAGCGSGGTLSAKALSQEAKSLQSLAAEGALVAHDASAGKTTRTFARAHSSDLEKTASQTASSLKSAKTLPALEPKLRRLATLARGVSADLKLLGHASKQEQRRLGQKLDKAAQQTKQIGSGL